jgi:hypothetical protein
VDPGPEILRHESEVYRPTALGVGGVLDVSGVEVFRLRGLSVIPLVMTALVVLPYRATRMVNTTRASRVGPHTWPGTEAPMYGPADLTMTTDFTMVIMSVVTIVVAC